MTSIWKIICAICRGLALHKEIRRNAGRGFIGSSVDKMKAADKKSYYAVIPADVRYDKALPANAKLLYGEITALCSEKGFCWASNSYFAELYDKEVRTIKRWISQLVEKGYISKKIDKGAGNKRQLYLVTKMTPPGDKIVTSSGQKNHHPNDKNVTHNNKDNTTLNITDNKVDSSQKDLSSKKEAQQHNACTLLMRYRVAYKVAHSIAFDQCTPPSSINEVIKNGLAEEEKAIRTGGKFRLGPGYIVKALNQARSEGKIVSSTKLSREFSAKLRAKTRKYEPLSKTETQKRVRRGIAALGLP